MADKRHKLYYKLCKERIGKDLPQAKTNDEIFEVVYYALKELYEEKMLSEKDEDEHFYIIEHSHVSSQESFYKMMLRNNGLDTVDMAILIPIFVMPPHLLNTFGSNATPYIMGLGLLTTIASFLNWYKKLIFSGKHGYFSLCASILEDIHKEQQRSALKKVTEK